MQWLGRGALAALALALGCAAPPGLAAGGQAPSRIKSLPADVRQFVATIVASGDHLRRPFAVVDKQRAQLHVFDASGHLRGTSAVLLGQTRGDASAPNVGENTQNGHVPVHQRTTPAGRFVAEPGRNLQGEHVVWVDYDAAFAIHRLRPGASHAPRVARLATPTPDDNRASWGCVVVPVPFYTGVVTPWIGRRASVVYVLPEDGETADLVPAGGRAPTARLRPTAIDHPG